MFDIIYKKRGSISLFLSIVLLSIVMLECVLIDTGKILLARNYVQNSANLTLNSALSDYDKTLQDVYGIFAVSKDDATFNKKIKEYFTKNIEDNSDGTEEFAKLLKLKVEEFDLIGESDSALAPDFGKNSELGNLVLESQIMEFMKYQIPKNFDDSILSKLDIFNDIGKWKGITKKFQEYGVKSAKLGKKVKDIYDDLDHIKQNANNGIYTNETIDEKINSINSIYDSLRRNIKEIQEKEEELENLPEPTTYIDDMGVEQEEDYGRDSLENEIDNLSDEIKDQQKEIKQELKDIDTNINNLKKYIKDILKYKGSIKNDIKELDKISKEWDAQIEELKATQDKFKKSKELIVGCNDENKVAQIDDIEAKLDKLFVESTNIDNYLDDISNLFDIEVDIPDESSEVENLKDSLIDTDSSYYSNIKTYSMNEQKISDLEFYSILEKRKQEKGNIPKSSANNVLEELKAEAKKFTDFWETLGDVKEDAFAGDINFNFINDYTENVSNKKDDEIGFKIDLQNDNLEGKAGEKFSKNLLNTIDKSNIGDKPTFDPVRKAIILDYATNMFASYPSLKDESKSYNEHKLIDITKTKFATGRTNDLEYIYWGNDSLSNNFKYTIGVLVSIRLVLNMVTLMLNPEFMSTVLNLATILAGWTLIGVPIVQFIIIGLIVISETMQDIVDLVNGESIKLLKTIDDTILGVKGKLKDVFVEFKTDTVGLVLSAGNIPAGNCVDLGIDVAKKIKYANDIKNEYKVEKDIYLKNKSKKEVNMLEKAKIFSNSLENYRHKNEIKKIKSEEEFDIIYNKIMRKQLKNQTNKITNSENFSKKSKKIANKANIQNKKDIDKSQKETNEKIKKENQKHKENKEKSIPKRVKDKITDKMKIEVEVKDLEFNYKQHLFMLMFLNPVLSKKDILARMTNLMGNNISYLKSDFGSNPNKVVVNDEFNIDKAYTMYRLESEIKVNTIFIDKFLGIDTGFNKIQYIQRKAY